MRAARKKAEELTRWIPLPEENGIFNYILWASAWSRRDLESVLSHFADDAVFEDRTFSRSAAGKAELRRLISHLFHSWDLDIRILAARFDPAQQEVELEWTRSGRRMPGSGNVTIDLHPSLPLAPKSKAHIRGVIRILWDYAMWRGEVSTQRNPMELVTVRDASKRKWQPRSLTVEEFRAFAGNLSQPFHTSCAALCLPRASDQRMSWAEMGGRGLAQQQVASGAWHRGTAGR